MTKFLGAVTRIIGKLPIPEKYRIAAIIAIALALLALLYFTYPPIASNLQALYSPKMLFPVPGGHKIGRSWAQHQGSDIGAPKGTVIVSGAAGVVKFAGSKPGVWNHGKRVQDGEGLTACGLYVEIYHPSHGVTVSYCHMSEIASDLEDGASVNAGQKIGEVGDTGHAFGYHLHVTVWKSGSTVNPELYFPMAG